MREANLTLPSTKEFARFSLQEANGLVTTLSMAVEGGGRQLRNPENLKVLNLSDHGDWRKNHLRTIEACLGKKPFFPEMHPALSEVYLNSEWNKLESFNTAIFDIIFPLFMGNITQKDICEALDRPEWMERGNEIAIEINYEMSIFQAFSQFGPETLLGILALTK